MQFRVLDDWGVGVAAGEESSGGWGAGGGFVWSLFDGESEVVFAVLVEDSFEDFVRVEVLEELTVDLVTGVEALHESGAGFENVVSEEDLADVLASFVVGVGADVQFVQVAVDVFEGHFGSVLAAVCNCDAHCSFLLETGSGKFWDSVAGVSLSLTPV